MRLIIVLVAALVVLATAGFGSTAFATNTAPDALSTESVDDAASSSSNRAPTMISNCTEITEPGFYELSENLTQREDDANCIEVRADDVVLDGNGYTIVMHQPLGEYGQGIDLREANNATIRNIAVTTGGNQPLENGVSIHRSDSLTIQNVTVTDWHTGIDISQSHDGRIENVTASQNSEGIRLDETTGFTVTNNTVVHNRRAIAGGVGIRILGTTNLSVSREHVVKNNTVRNNVKGVYVSESRNVTVKDNVLVNNDDTPTPAPGTGSHFNIRVSEATDVLVENNVIQGSTVQIADYRYGKENVVRNNTFNSSQLTLQGTDGARVVNNSLRNATKAPGLYQVPHEAEYGAISVIGESTDTVIEGNSIGSPVDGVDGIILWRDVSGVVIQRNDIEHAETGVRVGQTVSLVTIARNDIVGSDRSGVYVDYQTRSILIERNDIHDSGEAGVSVNANVTVQIHQNIIANNSEYGAEKVGGGVVNATNNYWGSSDGPSSPADRIDECDPNPGPLVDPVTGEPADGNGQAVSENPVDPGVSNVHFDSWLANPPEDAGNPDNDD